MTCETPDIPEILPAGPDGLVLRFSLRPEPEAMAAKEALLAALAETPPDGVVEICPALVSVFLRFDPARVRRAGLASELRRRARAVLAAGAPAPVPARRWRIPVAFGGDNGPELAEVAARTGQRPEAAVAEICAADLRVLAIGFAPGQPYLGLLPERWDVPRLSELAPEVPQGAVTVAVRQIVMFTAAGTTGWRMVGRAAFRNFMPEREEPILLRAGDAIRFVPASAEEIAALRDAPDGLGGARLEVLG
ncbi:5-oxoprolinase subunit B family protein [Celeribacter indicus]|uniref:Allophanate hydrolase subunit 1 n=1 Tax=Celeribacter indicus TaxID=1208324 RepID=A0A0B5DXT8_9RHOB|nr:carboxyltransferase domain-containing protein [Celeribacter indicus]AJE47814.1 allophanate hydrolase subunit 1 [Celeribacter indicus]SDW23764.1 sensor histidine kinase inhibitor, KipI family [Celeribacter indicus]